MDDIKFDKFVSSELRPDKFKLYLILTLLTPDFSIGHPVFGISIFVFISNQIVDNFWPNLQLYQMQNIGLEPEQPKLNKYQLPANHINCIFYLDLDAPEAILSG